MLPMLKFIKRKHKCPIECFSVDKYLILKKVYDCSVHCISFVKQWHLSIDV